MAKLEMEAAAMADRIPRSDLSRDFVYELVSRCERSSGYMDHAQSMFAACAEIHSQAKVISQPATYKAKPQVQLQNNGVTRHALWCVAAGLGAAAGREP